MMRRTTSARRSRSGFTLVELLVAMGLFALISLAGFTLLRGIISTRDRLDGRLERLAELQRGLYLMTLDLESMGQGPLEVEPDGIGFRTLAAGVAGGSAPMHYRLMAGTLRRQTGTVDQSVIKDVSTIKWRFLGREGGWSDQPTTAVAAGPVGIGPAATSRPRAVEVTLTLAPRDRGLSGPLRRVIELPSEP